MVAEAEEVVAMVAVAMAMELQVVDRVGEEGQTGLIQGSRAAVLGLVQRVEAEMGPAAWEEGGLAVDTVAMAAEAVGDLVVEMVANTAAAGGETVEQGARPWVHRVAVKASDWQVAAAWEEDLLAAVATVAAASVAVVTVAVGLAKVVLEGVLGKVQVPSARRRAPLVAQQAEERQVRVEKEGVQPEGNVVVATAVEVLEAVVREAAAAVAAAKVVPVAQVTAQGDFQLEQQVELLAAVATVAAVEASGSQAAVLQAVGELAAAVRVAEGMEAAVRAATVAEGSESAAQPWAPLVVLMAAVERVAAVRAAVGSGEAEREEVGQGMVAPAEVVVALAEVSVAVVLLGMDKLVEG